ncbi:diguanylate cyclase domain-containing protein [Pseudomonas aeruginosa]|uniref:sensor domain-containing diguanylate cyclase n=1 Tax=Pseudomonas aeruginosa TaxID=287 RepID=UPI0004B3F046|nr:diguanylate cyclase [Pseudomonas aeruginosa]KHE33533.1 PAS/PAC sensor-containing diguanylate cyclase [Pseudomonas aeruginosa]OXZ10357.1 PAS/PAC sensor-containing diguanylate cyclase [Pseudomonas aeruginosa]RUI13644.1 diguanylate cyclase [Pseudomonas aeruginosa]HBO6116549.1 diguanylate cyclase [Pseudomonas aeruginosa]HCE9574616.1 diguanylate cyclase [Pseudomonas aeruginosa]
MPLRTRLLWLFLPLLAASLGGIWLLSESILLSRFDREDQQRLQEGATVLHNRLDFELKRHLDIVRTYAWWDASYDFIQRPNETFEQENLDHEMLDDLGFDFVLFLDDRGHLQLKQWSPPAPDQRVLFGAPSASDQALLEALQQRAIRLGALDFRGRTDHSLSELLLVDNLPTLLVSVPISNNQGSAPAKGAILAGYFLDRERLANLREQMQADLQAMPNIATDSTWKPLRSRSGSTHNQALLSPRRFIGEHVQQVSVQYLSSSGEPQLRFDITKRRLLYIQGEKAINFFLGASLLVALGAFLVGYLALELWVLRRVQRLNREVAEVGRNAHSIRLSDFGNDELGQLAGEMNQMLERLEHSEARDRAILQSMRDGYFEMDVDGVILTVNPALCQLLGQTRETLIGHPYYELLGEDDLARARQPFQRAMQSGAGKTFAIPLQRADGSLGYFEATVSLIHDLQGELRGYRGIVRDVSDQIAYQQQLLEMAYRDPLTGLGNRKAFDEQLGQALLRAGSGGSELALLYLDLDRFKEVNDRFGHDVGDALLKAVAERVRSTLRQPDKAYRLGGDEFAVLLEDSQENNPQRLAERLLAALVQPLALNGERIDFVTPSIGIALYPRHAGDAEGLVRAADSAMYQAKRQRNRYCLYRAQA